MRIAAVTWSGIYFYIINSERLFLETFAIPNENLSYNLFIDSIPNGKDIDYPCGNILAEEQIGCFDT